MNFLVPVVITQLSEFLCTSKGKMHVQNFPGRILANLINLFLNMPYANLNIFRQLIHEVHFRLVLHLK